MRSIHYQLCDAYAQTFEVGMHELNRRWVTLDGATRCTELVAVLQALGEDRVLGPTETSRRVRIVVEAAKLPEMEQKNMASTLAKFPTTVRQAATTCLPQKFRRLVYPTQPQHEVPVLHSEAVEEPASTMVPQKHCQTCSPSHEPRSYASVVLLGTFADHDENRLVLEKNGFTPLRATNAEQLNAALDNDVCGVIVARSWWTAILEADREGVLVQILRHSSFIWLKFDAHNLPCSVERFREHLLNIRQVHPTTDEFVCHDGWRLTPFDLDALKRTRDSLASVDTIRFCHADIKDEQARVLIGATMKHANGRNFPGRFQLTRVDVNQIPGGRSYANIFRLVPDDQGTPLVAKIDDVERLRDEMCRFKRYAQKWDTALNPQLHYHAETSLIVFGLVESPEMRGRPAPTLEETLETMFYCEHWPDSYAGPVEEDLRELINRAIDKLQCLNAQSNDQAVSAKTSIACGPYDAMLRVGVEWKIANCSNGVDGAFAFMDVALAKARALAGRSIVHGDVQLRNILVRDAREPHFIDYANCGPGHPCFDLVRLESAVLFFCGRMNGDERELAALLLDILNGRTVEEIARCHPRFCTTRTNRIAIHTSIACRVAALEALSQVGGNEDDYLAMKYVVACQSLFILHLQAGVIRSQLAALCKLFRERPSWQVSRSEDSQ